MFCRCETPRTSGAYSFPVPKALSRTASSGSHPEYHSVVKESLGSGLKPPQCYFGDPFLREKHGVSFSLNLIENSILLTISKDPSIPEIGR